MEKVTLQFLGGAQTVTGSKFLLTVGAKRILIDAGLFQGLKSLRLQNWDPFPVPPASIDAILLTHAHIDHSGYIPRLVRSGFKGPVHCTSATKELCKILLPDTGYLQEEEAQYLLRKKASRHNPPQPLYSEKEAETALLQFVPHRFDSDIQVVPGVTARFQYAGHILGAASIHLNVHGKRLVFTGDIGRPNDPLFYPPAPIEAADFIVLESTYALRPHPQTDLLNDLAAAINPCLGRGGVVLIPAFTVGRAQALIRALIQLKKSSRLSGVPIYLNSPMANEVTDLFIAQNALHRLSDHECGEFAKYVTYVRHAEESIALNQRHGPMIIISASGMATGGRILHHIRQFAPDPKNLILLAGFQAAGTRGRSLQDGAKEIKMHGQLVPIRCAVQILENLSAHADGDEILTWLNQKPLHPQKVFVVHGEPESALAMRDRIAREKKWQTIVPRAGEEFDLNPT